MILDTLTPGEIADAVTAVVIGVSAGLVLGLAARLTRG